MPAALSLLLAGVFLASGAAKLRDPAGMVVLVRRVLAPTVPAFALTRTLAATEVVLGAVLLTGIAPRVGAVVAAGALVAFTVLLRLAARRAPAALASCHCFGGAGDAPPAQALVRNLVLVVAAAVVVAWPPAASWELGTQELAGALTVAAGLSCAWLLATALRRLVVVP
ncbi:MauE/DoxX family redox-associated membrane protein [Patulibacter minatonensis]|uniref:MauE/DoxX family redox-associated membrane protein n=1 Tax=Patulibacter minatonensis TaxID=298163 RepID=UPI0004AD1AF4|nr:MauE/DoxX family redox-associated membrane protein [Patulibacter minatonensis]